MTDDELATQAPVPDQAAGSSRADLPAWQTLTRHTTDMRDVALRELFDSEPHRADDLRVEAIDIYADFSKH